LKVENPKIRAQVVVINNGVEFPTQTSNTKVQPPTALVVSNFHTYKGYETLIRAIEKSASISKFQFIGDGAIRNEMEKLVTELNLGDRISFLGNQDPSQHLRLCQYAIHPSETEGLSNAILEEMSYGLPIIAADIPGNRTLVTHNWNGLLFEPKNEIELARNIYMLERDLDMRSAFQKNALLRVKEYGWDEAAEKFLLVVNDILKSKD